MVSARALACFLVADDLTGACDAAVHFAARGQRAVVPIAPGQPLPEADVIAVSTASRDLPPAGIPRAIAAAACLPIGTPRILFKKIDSTLRGHPGVEIAAALDAFSRGAAVVCPAFPGTGRLVRDGILHVEGAADFAPIDIPSYLRAQGVECVPAAPEALREAIGGGARVVLLDAACDADLDRIAAAGLALDRPILWVGSAGLAAALARTLPAGPPRRAIHPRRGPVLLVIGSDHPVTLAQQAALVARRRALSIDAGIGAALAGGHHVLLRIACGSSGAAQLNALVASAPAAALVLSGGDTAALFCQAVAVCALELIAEIVPGVPWGVIRGGAFDGVPVATKSGGFGDADALIQVVDFFACQNH
ncbi:MAG TPA: four-carbon acid sugar kinase family protein [Candidatus Sulfopaludibacter sp.]|nr:four-carbon acid sugar kinase family protein [Candidatus Sulfopaludibacter sp.]